MKYRIICCQVIIVVVDGGIILSRQMIDYAKDHNNTNTVVIESTNLIYSRNFYIITPHILLCAFPQNCGQ